VRSPYRQILRAMPLQTKCAIEPAMHKGTRPVSLSRLRLSWARYVSLVRRCLAGRQAAHRNQPGMPAEVFIKTDERTVLSYLMKPLRDQMERALRER
jgi:hypothetical protein